MAPQHYSSLRDLPESSGNSNLPMTPPGLCRSYTRLGCLLGFLIGHAVLLALGLIEAYEIIFG